MLARLTELIKYRELLRNLIARDLKVRYRNSVLGVVWSLLNPLLMMLVFTVVFTVMMPNNTVQKFPVFFLCGLLPWNFFSASVMGATGSIVDNAHLIKKVYFPREVLPISLVLSNLVNFFLALVVLFVLILVFRIPITPWLLLLPVVILIQVMFTVGIALFLSTVNVFYRDTQMIVDVLLLALFFLTPIFYPIDILPHNKTLLGIQIDVWRWTRILNPMASLIAAYRDVLYWGRLVGPDFLFRTAATALAFLAGGYYVFCRYSRVFGEEV